MGPLGVVLGCILCQDDPTAIRPTPPQNTPKRPLHDHFFGAFFDQKSIIFLVLFYDRFLTALGAILSAKKGSKRELFGAKIGSKAVLLVFQKTFIFLMFFNTFGHSGLPKLSSNCVKLGHFFASNFGIDFGSSWGSFSTRFGTLLGDQNGAKIDPEKALAP